MTAREELEREIGIRRESDGHEYRLGVTAERVAELRRLAKAAGPDALFGDALRDAVLFYDLVRKAWEGLREEYDELSTEQARLTESLVAARNGDPLRCPACYASPKHHYGWCKLAATEINLRTLRARVAEVTRLYSAMPAIPSQSDLKAFATATMATLENWAKDEQELRVIKAKDKLECAKAEVLAAVEKCVHFDARGRLGVEDDGSISEAVKALREARGSVP